AAVLDELRDSVAIRRAIAEAERQRPVAPVPPRAGPGRLVTDVVADLRYGSRLARRNPGFAAVALLTIALGIGLTTSIFSVLRAVVLRPLPYPAADRLLMVWGTDRNAGTAREPVSVPDLLDFTARSRRMQRFGAFGSYDANVQPSGEDPFRVSALAVSDLLLELLGVAPVAGRSFHPDEYHPGRPPVVLISERLWARVFNRSTSALGASLRMNDRQVAIAGVVADNADFGVLQILSSAAYARGFADRDTRTRVDVWSPMQADRRAPRGQHGLLMLGRLAPGATSTSAQEELTNIAADLERTYPDNDGRGAYVEPIGQVVLGRVRAPLALLMGGTILVLLIACGNLAILLLARGTARTGEIVVRTALGAETPRMLRQFFVENILLSGAGAIVGLAMAYGTLQAIRVLAPADIPRIANVGLDVPVLLVALTTSVVVAFTFGLFPLAQVRAAASGFGAAATGRHGTAAHHGRAHSLFVAAEVAMTVVLLISAGLLARSLWLMYRVDPGFETMEVLKAEFQLPSSRYRIDFGRPAAPDSTFARFTHGLVERVERLPGVRGAALAAQHPLDAGFTTSFTVAGREAEGREWPELAVRPITPGYFATLGVPIARGRPFDARDLSSPARSVIVNEAFVDRFFRDDDPIGHRLRFFGSTEWTIVGIVGNERFRGVTTAAPSAAYVLLDHVPLPMLALVVRTTGDPVALVPGVRSAAREVDPALALFAVEPLADTLAGSLAQHRFVTTLLGLFAALAVVLATLGVYGVLSYAVVRRTPDIGVRIALGADTRQVLRLVLGQGAVLTISGTIAGVGLALASSRWMSSLLFEVSPTDPVTIGAVVLLVGAVAVVATWVPARRATRIDPMASIKQ
ncbi:MAG TPA: ABC transporter permease, partial [Vicinamibacterales bacterium]|nr:ABC transporter permease [Vicinamibacterales bacterium]